jgi:hypothetical protein
MKRNFLLNKISDSISGAKPGTGFQRNQVMKSFITENKEFVAIFLREFIQNTFDAWILDKNGTKDLKNKIKITLSIVEKKDGLNTNSVSQLISKKKPIAEAFKVTKNITKNENINDVLIYHESNTTGLTGNTKDTSDVNSKFMKYLNSSGDRDKEGDIGSEGVGKITGYLASKINTMFICSLRGDPFLGDNKEIFIGKTELIETPRINNHIYAMQAIYGHDGKGNDGYLPIEDLNEVTQAKKVLCINRNKNDSGTTFAILSPKEELKDKTKMIRTYIEEFLFLTIEQEISIEMFDELIDDQSILNLAKKYCDNSPENKEWRRFISDIAQGPTSKGYEKHLKKVDQDWQINGEFNPQTTDMTEAKEKFENGDLVGLLVPIELGKKKENGKETKITSEFKIFVKRPESNCIKKMVFRKGLQISNEVMLQGNNKGAPIMIAIIIDNDEMSQFLADSEVNNHLLFNGSKEEFISKWGENNGKTRLSQFRKSLSYVVDIFVGVDLIIEKITSNTLHIPSIDPKGTKNKKRKIKIKKPKKKTPSKSQKPPLHSYDSSFHNGIRLKSADPIPSNELPKKIEILLCYAAIGVSNPFTKYDINDFDLSNMKSNINSKNITNITTIENVLTAEITHKDWEISIGGFPRAVLSNIIYS